MTKYQMSNEDKKAREMRKASKKEGRRKKERRRFREAERKLPTNERNAKLDARRRSSGYKPPAPRSPRRWL